MNSTEVQNPRCKLDDNHMCLVLFLPVQSLLTCFRSFPLRTLSLITLPQTLKLFYVSLHSQAPQKQYIVHCMHYGITLWAYLSEPLKKDIHKRLSSTEKPQYNTTCSSHLITHYRYIRVTEKYTETLHMKKIGDLVAVR